MANQVTNYKCPACTGPLRFDSATGKLLSLIHISEPTRRS